MSGVEELPEDIAEYRHAIQQLRDRCKTILQDCEQWGPIHGFYRYTQALTAEINFLEKVLYTKKVRGREDGELTWGLVGYIK